MALDLAGAIPYPLDSGIAPEAFDRIVVHQTHTAVDLQRGICHPRQHLRGIKLGRSDLAVRRKALIKPVRSGKGQKVGGINLGDHVGNLKTHTLKLADRLAKLLALGGIGQGIVEHPTRPAHTEGGNRDARGIEPGVHHIKPAIDLAQDLRIGQAAIVELEDHVFVAAMADRFVSVPDGKARRAAIDEESGDPLLGPFGCVVFASGDEDYDEIGMIGARDEMLGAVHHPIAAITAGRTFHAAHVRTGPRLGHRQRIHPLAAHGGTEIALDLLAFAGCSEDGRRNA